MLFSSGLLRSKQGSVSDTLYRGFLELHRTRQAHFCLQGGVRCSGPIHQIPNWIKDFFVVAFSMGKKKAGRWSLCTDMGFLGHFDGSYGNQRKDFKW